MYMYVYIVYICKLGQHYEYPYTHAITHHELYTHP